MTESIRTTVSIPQDLKSYLEENNINASQLLQDAIKARRQEGSLPDWYYSDELPRKEELIRFIRSVHDSDEGIRRLQYFYHRLTSEFDQEDTKVESLRNFIVDLANPNHPSYSEILRKSLEHDVILRDEIFGDSGLIEQKEKLLAEIDELQNRKFSEQNILNETIRKLSSQITDSNRTIAFLKEKIETSESELKALEDQAYKMEVKLGEYRSIEKVLGENASLKQKISSLESEMNEQKNRLMARISELEKSLKEVQMKYEDATEGFVPLSQANTVYLFKSVSKAMKRALRSKYSAYKVVGDDTFLKIENYKISR